MEARSLGLGNFPTMPLENRFEHRENLLKWWSHRLLTTRSGEKVQQLEQAQSKGARRDYPPGSRRIETRKRSYDLFEGEQDA